MEQHSNTTGKGAAPLSILGQHGREHNAIAQACAEQLARDLLVGVQYGSPPQRSAALAMEASGLRVRLWCRMIKHQREDGDRLIVASVRVMSSARSLLEGEETNGVTWRDLRRDLTMLERSGLSGDLLASWTRSEALDDAAWIHIAAREAPVLIWRPDQFLRLLANEDTRRQDKQRPHVPAQLHPGQERAMEFLSMLMGARFTGIQAAGIKPRCHGLVLGSSGSGKSFLAHELAARSQAELVTTTVGRWLLVGDDRQQATLNLIARWINDLPEERKAVLFIDEIDKMQATTQDNHNAIYTRACFDELLALLDGRVEATDWSSATTERFANDVFVVCAGAFQSLYPSTEVVFDEEWEGVAAADKVWQAGILPDELLMRLSPGAIEVPPPGADWLAAKLAKIDTDIFGRARHTPEQYRQLAREMVRSRRNLRSLEGYVIESWAQKHQVPSPPDHFPNSDMLGLFDDTQN